MASAAASPSELPAAEVDAGIQAASLGRWGLWGQLGLAAAAAVNSLYPGGLPALLSPPPPAPPPDPMRVVGVAMGHPGLIFYSGL
jgi:hypothetical protein